MNMFRMIDSSSSKNNTYLSSPKNHLEPAFSDRSTGLYVRLRQQVHLLKRKRGHEVLCRV